MSENTQPTPELVAKGKEPSSYDLRYGIGDNPPWYECIGLGFQCFLTMVGGIVAGPLIVTMSLCIPTDDHTSAGEIVSTTIFVCGIVTLLQSTVGSRLPIVQGGSIAFMAPLFAILKLPEYACEPDLVGFAVNTTVLNETNTTTWHGRMQVLQGCLTVASLFEILIGFIGGIGFLIRFIGPITIAPTILLIGLSMVHVVEELCSTQWWIALMTTFLLALFSQVMLKISIPGTKKHTRIFQKYAVLLTIVISWSICAILTVTDVLPATPGSWGYEARTDIRAYRLDKTPWFRFPYPGQFGRMRFNLAGIIGMIIASIASILESIGDYHACARICGAPPPPVHAVNRGIFIEGIGCLIAGLWGTGLGTTSFSENIGAIGLTKVASRRVIQVGAAFIMLVGIFGKFGAVLDTIPRPVVGGILLVVMGMICSIGISNLHTSDMHSMRNMFIVGLSLFIGLVLPRWVSTHKNTIELGNEMVNQAVVILLTTSMAVGGVIAFVLDNAIPGTQDERGMRGYRYAEQVQVPMENGTSNKKAVSYETYDMPFGMAVIRSLACLRYIPISPTHGSKPHDSVNGQLNGEHANEGFDSSDTTVP